MTRSLPLVGLEIARELGRGVARHRLPASGTVVLSRVANCMLYSDPARPHKRKRARQVKVYCLPKSSTPCLRRRRCMLLCSWPPPTINLLTLVFGRYMNKEPIVYGFLF